jgi:hypothetical protein
LASRFRGTWPQVADILLAPPSLATSAPRA